MELIVQLKVGADPVAGVRRLAGKWGVALAQLYPGTSDTTLATWYGAALPAGVNAPAIVAELRAHADVESAYVKPQGAAP